MREPPVPPSTYGLIANTRARRGAPVPADNFPDLRATETALDEIASWPDYEPTRIIELDDVAQQVFLRGLAYKDEGPRFGVGSFKPLGSGYGVARIVARAVADASGEKVAPSDLLSERFRELAQRVTVTCATDGNHGRAVAWASRVFGCRAVVYLASNVTPERETAIAAYGAEVVRTTGNHEDAIRQAAEDAARHGWVVVSEGARASSAEIARDLMVGYATVLEELVRQTDGKPPTHLFVQVGVGGFAAGCAAYAAQRWGEACPTIVAVEAEAASCLYKSVEIGGLVSIGGSFDTIMAGLAAGEVSEYAWPLLSRGVDFCMTIPDKAAVEVMRLLARQDPPVIAGESGAAGLAAALAVAQDPDARNWLDVDDRSRLLTIGTEGATDESSYARLVGSSPAEVRRGEVKEIRDRW